MKLGKRTQVIGNISLGLAVVYGVIALWAGVSAYAGMMCLGTAIAAFSLGGDVGVWIYKGKERE